MDRVHAIDQDTEKGLLSHDSHSIDHLHHSNPDSHDFKDIPHGHHLSNLRIFQDLVGIRTPPNILSPELPLSQSTRILRHNTADLSVLGDRDVDQHLTGGRPRRDISKLLFSRSTANGGIYKRAIDEELKARIGFELSSICINLIYIVQILIAATITGLASYTGHKVALTVLGAINTVLAGLCAYLKGQGLPTRLLRSRDQFQGIVKSIENTERLFARYVYMPSDMQSKHDPFAEAKKLEDLFDAAKRDQQDNYPDIYLNNHEKQALTDIDEKNRRGDAVAGTSKEDFAKQRDLLAQRVEALEKQLQAKEGKGTGGKD